MKKCNHQKQFPLWIDEATEIVFYKCPECKSIGRREVTRISRLIINTPFRKEE